MVVPGKERGPRRAAERRGVKAIVLQAVARHLFQGGHLDRSAERTAASEPDVVDQHDYHIRRPWRSFHLEAWRRLRVTRVQSRNRRQFRPHDRQHRTIKRRICSRAVLSIGRERECRTKGKGERGYSEWQSGFHDFLSKPIRNGKWPRRWDRGS